MPRSPIAPPGPPLLWPARSTPEHEHEAIKTLHAQLCGVRAVVQTWTAGLDLYRFAGTHPPSVPPETARQWRFLAAQACAMQLHGLAERLRLIVGRHTRPQLSFQHLIDFDRTRSARARLRRAFPQHEPLRDAVAHAHDRDASGHDRTDASPLGALTGFMQPNIYSVPDKNARYHLALTADTQLELEAIVAEFFSGFQALAAWLEREGHLP